ncbi:hypothetical protein DAI22_11g097033 [Oryza sativa Japonica Group]|nr:hypothetical protein DAI22_11g097033 [Oryza sativa Japonica Group]
MNLLFPCFALRPFFRLRCSVVRSHSMPVSPVLTCHIQVQEKSPKIDRPPMRRHGECQH